MPYDLDTDEHVTEADYRRMIDDGLIPAEAYEVTL